VFEMILAFSFPLVNTAMTVVSSVSVNKRLKSFLLVFSPVSAKSFLNAIDKKKA
jgi:hypothetical protein